MYNQQLKSDLALLKHMQQTRLKTALKVNNRRYGKYYNSLYTSRQLRPKSLRVTTTLDKLNDLD